jgi:hypothetical protein
VNCAYCSSIATVLAYDAELSAYVFSLLSLLLLYAIIVVSLKAAHSIKTLQLLLPLLVRIQCSTTIRNSSTTTACEQYYQLVRYYQLVLVLVLVLCLSATALLFFKIS